MPTITATDAAASKRIAVDPTDPRYPRSRALSALRWLVRLAWLAFLLYPANALFNLFALAANGIPLTGPSIAQALLLDRLLPLLILRPLVVAAGAVVVIAIVLLGRIAHLDQERERETLRLRRDMERTRTVAEVAAHTAAHAEVHAAAQTTAAVILDRIDEHLAAQPKPNDESAPPEPQGPPFDEALLPLPEHFVGRAGDLDWLMDRLRAGGAIGITALRGMGGIGKTSLAAVAVRQARREGLFPDGIAVVPCNDLSDASEVVRRTLARFDPMRRQPKAGDLAGLAEAAHRLLDDKGALVVLDNVEPGLAVTEVVAPLRETGAALLMTARQTLPRAAVPAEASRVLDLLTPGEALDLFAESFGRGSAASLAPAEHAAAERIVTALDRHTLAIKLAGAYAADVHRDLGALARELEDPQQAMALPEDEVPQAVRQVFASSLEALPPEARRLFAGLAAFTTEEFGRQAALALGGSLDLSRPETGINLLVLRALVEASTNETMPEGSDRERLRLHSLLRAYAATEFARWSEPKRDVASLAVARHYATYVGRTQERALGRDELNITGALEWAHDHRQDELVVALCLGMRSFWANRGRNTASDRYLPWGIAAAGSLAGATGAREDRMNLARLGMAYGEMLSMTAHWATAEEVLLANLALRRELQDQSGEGEVLLLLGEMAFRQGKESEYTLQSLAAFRAAYDREGEARVLYTLGYAAFTSGQLEVGMGYLAQALAIAQEQGYRRVESDVLEGLGYIAYFRGQLADAERYHLRGLAICRDLPFRQGESIHLYSLGRLARQGGRLDDADRYCQQALEIVREVQDRQGEAYVLREMGRLAQARHLITEAQAYFERSLRIARQVSDRIIEGGALCGLGILAEMRGEIAEAETLLRDSLVAQRDGQDGPSIAESCLALGRLLAERLGNLDEGCLLLREAAQRYAEMGMPEAEEARAALERLGCGE